MPLRCIQLSSRHCAMSLKHEPKYPSRRAYVLKLRSDATPATLGGRLENLVTGRLRQLKSWSHRLRATSRGGTLQGRSTQRANDMPIFVPVSMDLRVCTVRLT